MLGPRLGRYDEGIDALPLGCPVNALMGLFVLWWGWLAFNSGSTYGVSGMRWKYAARAAVSTMLASMGGGLVGLGFSLANPKRIDILSQINGILGSLVAVTGISGFWGVMAIGFFADDPHPLNTTSGRKGLFKGGGWYLLGVQLLTGVCLSVWSFTSSVILLWIIDKIIPIRMDEHEELLGADLVEHRIHHSQIGVSRALSALHPLPSKKQSLNGVPSIGTNPGHDSFILKVIRVKRLNNGLKIFHRRPLIRMENTFEEKLQIPTINSSNSDSLKLAWTN